MSPGYRLGMSPGYRLGMRLLPLLNTNNESSEIESEHCRGVRKECKLLEESRLDEGISLNTLCLLHRHLQTIAADKTGCHLQ